ncbi:uncharacterized protein LOC127800173 isoform X2 [Diospyros lotus]|nr:uncharacterized protein LOC127800173 isoform X2 [Diospyros lotus]
MKILVISDTTTLSYWLSWNFLICAIWVLMPMSVASYIIWKYEGSDYSKSERRNQQEKIQFLHDDKAWRPCLKEIHPFWLLSFRLFAFFVLLGVLVADIIVQGAVMLLYYTQWTFILVTIYFGFGTVLSIYGCHQYYKAHTAFKAQYVGIESEQGLYVPLAYGETTYGVGAEKNLIHEKNDDFPIVGILAHTFQVIFQMSAGAVVLTDCIYWFIIFPFLTIKDYDMNYLTVIMHTLNGVVLLLDTALNCLKFPWFRISYLILWTGVYVIFQWILHACVSLGWPYPFLELSAQYAPLWYLLVALMHIPCYGLFSLIMLLKHYMLSTWFPQSYQCLR